MDGQMNRRMDRWMDIQMERGEGRKNTDKE